ncbi:MAG: AlpA family phage regulatory protein [Pseudomonadota bacterium]
MSQIVPTLEAPDRYVSIKEFSHRSSLARSTVYRLIDAGEISKPRRLTAKRVGWPVDEIDAWMAARGAA